ncbi:hypothetical protein AVEN_154855-1 [Araneus ventricosus]|uniref:Uncharacterized protein n=1 Tax=Araneus ventricosus TaxID=182803 RepID=A0A4Y2RRX9_ARAVE|nr:hypothetical protein AVEN_154855-1 [Araneus ventricosus]
MSYTTILNGVLSSSPEELFLFLRFPSLLLVMGPEKLRGGQNHRDEERCRCKNHNKVLELLPYPSSPNISNKSLTRDCCYSRKCYTGDSLENNIKCFAKCHKKHQDEHEVSIMTGIVSNYNDGGLPDEKDEALKVIESFVNEKALEEFGKRRGNSIDKSDCKTLCTVARQQFCKEISDCFQQRRKSENRK